MRKGNLHGNSITVQNLWRQRSKIGITLYLFAQRMHVPNTLISKPSKAHTLTIVEMMCHNYWKIWSFMFPLTSMVTLYDIRSYLYWSSSLTQSNSTSQTKQQLDIIKPGRKNYLLLFATRCSNHLSMSNRAFWTGIDLCIHALSWIRKLNNKAAPIRKILCK
jgi:hypothetical protein